MDDDAKLLIRWPDGTNSIVESGGWQPHLPGLEAGTEVHGTSGYARIWDFTGGPPGYQHGAQPVFFAQMREFAGAASQGRGPGPAPVTAWSSRGS